MVVDIPPWDPAAKSECVWHDDCVEDRYGKYKFEPFRYRKGVFKIYIRHLSSCEKKILDNILEVTVIIVFVLHTNYETRQLEIHHL